MILACFLNVPMSYLLYYFLYIYNYNTTSTSCTLSRPSWAHSSPALYVNDFCTKLNSSVGIFRSLPLQALLRPRALLVTHISFKVQGVFFAQATVYYPGPQHLPSLLKVSSNLELPSDLLMDNHYICPGLTACLGSAASPLSSSVLLHSAQTTAQ